MPMNVTDRETPMHYYGWIVGKVVHLCLLVISIYLLTAHLIYCVHKYKQLRALKHLCRSTHTNGKLILDLIMGIATLSLVFRTVVDIEWFMGRPSTNRSCLISERFEISTITISLVTVYIFLWFRHKLVYSHPTLEVLRTPFVQVLRVITIFCIIVGTSAVVVLYVIVTDLKAVEYGCEYNTSIPLYNVRYYIVISVCCLIQLLLLWLFVYPLILHHKSSEHLNISSRIIPTMKRVIAATLVSGFSDLTVGITSAIHQDLYNVLNILYSLNAIVNVVCIFGSYANWKQRLFPMLKTAELGSNKSSVRTMPGLLVGNESNQSLRRAYSVSMSKTNNW